MNAASRDQTTLPRPLKKPADAAAARGAVSIVHPFHLARRIAFAGGAVVFGRAVDSEEYRLDDETVSRRHLEIRFDSSAGGYQVRDLGSRNGSRLDGAPLGETWQRLSDNGVLRAGDVLLVFESEGATPVTGGEALVEVIPGASPRMARLRREMTRAGPDPSPVLILGETGVGKEAVARELHAQGGAHGELIVINCAALSPTLIESQLFGHAKGAFTGAGAAQDGLAVAADGGSLFLDEVGELPLELQPKLLRLIQHGEVLPVGSTVTRRVQTRIIAATNRELSEAAETGAFRRDLYARLSLWELRVPPLRERRVDILTWLRLLFRQWLADRDRAGDELRPLDADVAEAVVSFSWEDNLRGLERLIHHLASRSGEGAITPAELPAWLDVVGSEDDSAASRRPVPTREEFLATFEKLDRSVRATAKHFGRDRRQVYRWLDKYGVRADGEDDG